MPSTDPDARPAVPAGREPTAPHGPPACAVVLLLAWLVTGCGLFGPDPLPPPVTPSASVAVDLWPGSPVTGVRRPAPDASWDGWQRITLEVVAFAREPDAPPLDPLTRSTRLLLAPGERVDGALMAAPRLLAGARAQPGALPAPGSPPADRSGRTPGGTSGGTPGDSSGAGSRDATAARAATDGPSATDGPAATTAATTAATSSAAADTGRGPAVRAEAAVPRGATAEFHLRATPAPSRTLVAADTPLGASHLADVQWSLLVTSRADGDLEVALQREDPSMATAAAGSGPTALEPDDAEATVAEPSASGPRDTARSAAGRGPGAPHPTAATTDGQGDDDATEERDPRDPLGLEVPAPAGRETAVLVDAGEPAWTLLLPCPLPGSPDAGLWVVARLEDFPDGDARGAAVARALDLLAREAPHAAAVTRGLARLAATVEVVVSTRQRRSLLSSLAERSGAPLTHDVVLSIPDDLVDRLAAALNAHVDADGLPADDAALGWLLEQTTLALLVDLPEEHPAASACRAVLGVRTGGLAYRRNLLEDLVDSATGLAAFEAGVVEENIVLLDDRDPIGRVRAHAWLAARGAAPEGFDPLAPREERQAVLTAWLAARAAADGAADGAAEADGSIGAHGEADA